MKTRKLIAALLAVACVSSLSVPAFADDEIKLTPATGTEVSNAADLANFAMAVSTNIQAATLKVTLPNAVSVLVNPYRMEVDISAAGDGSDPSYDTVLSPEIEITNGSKCAISVGVLGQVTTYQKLAAADIEALPADTNATIAITNGLKDPTGKLLTKDSSITGAKVVSAVTDIYVDKATKKIYTDADGYVLTAKYTATTYKLDADKNPTTEVNKAGTMSITGYTANKDIKVATAALKNPDTDTSNSLFVFVEGRTEDGEYAGITGKAVSANSTTPAGQLVLTGQKDAQGKVLYLKGDQKGYVRVTGDATTAPKNSWLNYDGLFSTPFIFQIDAVANPAPKTPTATKATVETDGAGTVSVVATSGKTNEWDVTVTGSAKNDNFTFGLEGLDPDGATLAFAGTNDLTGVGSTDGVLAQAMNIPAAGVTGNITITATSMGKSATFTLHVTIK